MELLDRYLQAVGRHLPRRRQDDILAELRANLEAQLEDMESGLGRPLSAEEAETWLKQLGSPMQMAAHYQPMQYLIGPGVFPMYWHVLRLALGWMFLIYVVVNAVQIATQTPTGDAVAEAVMRLPGIVFTVAGWVTLFFAIFELTAARNPGKFACHGMGGWSPACLPPLETAAGKGKARRSYSRAVAEAIFGFLALAWLLSIPAHPWLLFGPGALYLKASPFQPAPVWWQAYWWIVGLNLLQLAWRCTDLVRGTWQEPPRLRRIVLNGVGLVPIVLLLAAPGQSLVALKSPVIARARYGADVAAWNHGLHTALLVVCLIVSLQLVWDVGKMSIERYRQRA